MAGLVAAKNWFRIMFGYLDISYVVFFKDITYADENKLCASNIR
jgi:hypothetical protein